MACRGIVDRRPRYLFGLHTELEESTLRPPLSVSHMNVQNTDEPGGAGDVRQ